MRKVTENIMNLKTMHLIFSVLGCDRQVYVASLLFFKSSGIVTPLLDKGGDIVGQVTVEVHLLTCCGMHEAKRLGMQCLTRTQLKAVLYELVVAGGLVTAQHLVAAVALVAE